MFGLMGAETKHCKATSYAVLISNKWDNNSEVFGIEKIIEKGSWYSFFVLHIDYIPIFAHIQLLSTLAGTGKYEFFEYV